MSNPAREQFFWHGPGPFSGEPTVPEGGRDAETGKVLEPPPNFLLMLLHPTRVKYLRLSDNFAQVDEYCAAPAPGPDPEGAGGEQAQAAEGWRALRVNP